ncbi:unnamed protein product [Symbiodinium sp. CCMP2592]|nr:unnamed protein product [Symbiodinium sp. CCMP2592]
MFDFTCVTSACNPPPPGPLTVKIDPAELAKRAAVDVAEFKLKEHEESERKAAAAKAEADRRAAETKKQQEEAERRRSEADARKATEEAEKLRREADAKKATEEPRFRIFHSGQLRANPELPLAKIVACCGERLRASVSAMAVPEGYVPVVAFRFCPPSGVYFQLGMYLLDMVNDMVQICTFLLHRDWWFAGFMIFFVLLSLLLTVGGVSHQSTLKRFDPLGEARLCLARGVTTKAWESMLSCERNVEAPGTGLIGPYGAALLQLTPLQAASCLYGLVSSAKAMAEGRLQMEDPRCKDGPKKLLPVDARSTCHVVAGSDGAKLPALKAVRPATFTALFAWYLGAFAAELAAFAVASATLHPLVIVPGYMLGAVANSAAAWWSGSQDFLKAAVWSCATVITVSVAMVGRQTTSILPMRSASIGNGPGFFAAISIPVRFITWTALCFRDLPQGLAPFGSLGRPMGLPVLRQKFLEPATALQEALACFTSQFWMSVEAQANATSEEVVFGDCAWPTTGELSSASTILNTCLLLLAVVLVPLHMCIVVGMLLFNPTYACAADNLPLKEEVEAKQREINDFATQNEQAAGQHELLRCHSVDAAMFQKQCRGQPALMSPEMLKDQEERQRRAEVINWLKSQGFPDIAAPKKTRSCMSTSHQYPLHKAVTDGNGRIVKLLLEMHANPKLKNSKGKTPLEVAKKTKTTASKEIISLLEDAAKRA